MKTYQFNRASVWPSVLFAVALLFLVGCSSKESAMDLAQLQDFGTRYTAAWNSQDPSSVAAFFEEGGSLQINDGDPSTGRAAITATAKSFMTALPDMVLTMDEVAVQGAFVVYRWTLDGTNTGPGGTGNRVHISGYEEWAFGASGLVAKSLGHMDETEYSRQLKSGI